MNNFSNDAFMFCFPLQVGPMNDVSQDGSPLDDPLRSHSG